MKNKYNVQLVVPMLYETYDILIPINKTIGEIVYLLSKALKDLSQGSFNDDSTLNLYNANEAICYNLDDFVYNTNIVNGSTLVLC